MCEWLACVYFGTQCDRINELHIANGSVCVRVLCEYMSAGREQTSAPNLRTLKHEWQTTQKQSLNENKQLNTKKWNA